MFQILLTLSFTSHRITLIFYTLVRKLQARSFSGDGLFVSPGIRAERAHNYLCVWYCTVYLFIYCTHAYLSAAPIM